MATRPTKIPRWADDPEASIVEPAESKKNIGWEAAEKPPASYFNWLFSSIIAWIKWLSDLPIRMPGNVLELQNTTRVSSLTGTALIADGHTGVDASATAAAGAGVSGRNDVDGGTGPGVYGLSGGTGAGVRGEATGEGDGVRGSGPVGVRGVGSANGTGVIGIGGTGAGAGVDARPGSNGPAIIIGSRSSAPTVPGTGWMYFDSTLKKVRYYNGTAWVDL